MQSRVLTAVIIIGVVVLAAWIAVTNVRHWGDWIVLGVIIVTTFGFALAIYNPKYPTKKRTFVRTSKPDRYGRRR